MNNYSTKTAVSSFSLTESGQPYPYNGMMVYPSARLLSTGDYSDKGFAKRVTANELRTLVSTFAAGNAPVNIEHESVVAGTGSKTALALHGHMGQVSRVWLSDAADWVHGEVQIPLWLDAAIKTGVVPSKLSVEVYPDTMRLAGVALTGDPRVPNAALMSAASVARRGETESLSRGVALMEMTSLGRAFLSTEKGQQMIEDSEDTEDSATITRRVALMEMSDLGQKFLGSPKGQQMIAQMKGSK